MTWSTFGDRLFSRRVQLNLTQAELGADVGRTPTCVSYWENNRREPSLSDLAKLAKSLETSLDWLVLGDRNGTIGATKGAPRAACNDRGAGKGEVAPMQHRAYTGRAS